MSWWFNQSFLPCTLWIIHLLPPSDKSFSLLILFIRSCLIHVRFLFIHPSAALTLTSSRHPFTHMSVPECCFCPDLPSVFLYASIFHRCLHLLHCSDELVPSRLQVLEYKQTSANRSIWESEWDDWNNQLLIFLRAEWANNNLSLCSYPSDVIEILETISASVLTGLLFKVLSCLPVCGTKLTS